MILINLKDVNEYLTQNDLPEITEEQVLENDMIYQNFTERRYYEHAINIDYIIDHYAEMQHVNLKDLQSKVVMTLTH